MIMLLSLLVFGDTLAQGATLTQGATLGVAAAATTGEDFSDRSTCFGLFFLDSSDPNAQTDHCPVGSGVDVITWDGTSAPGFTNAVLPPGVTRGSTALAMDLSVSGSLGFTHADETDYEEAQFTNCAWVQYLASGDHHKISDKGEGDGWEHWVNTAAFEGSPADRQKGTIDTTTEPGTERLIGPNGLRDPLWWHLCLTYDGGGDNTIRVYRNGEEDCDVACATVVGPTLASTQDLEIGHEGAGEEMLGAMYEWMYFSEVFTAQEICQTCRCGLRDDARDRVLTCNSCNMGVNVCANQPATWGECDGTTMPCTMSFEGANCAADNITQASGTTSCEGGNATQGSDSLSLGPNAGESRLNLDDIYDVADYVDILWMRFSIRHVTMIASTPEHPMVALQSATEVADGWEVASDEFGASNRLELCVSAGGVGSGCGGAAHAGTGTGINTEYRVKFDYANETILWIDHDEDFEVYAFPELREAIQSGTGGTEGTGFFIATKGDSAHEIRFDRLCINTEDSWEGCYP